MDLKSLVIGKDITRDEYIKLIDLENARHQVEAARVATEERVKKLHKAPGPVTLVFKPIIYVSRRSDQEELEAEMKAPQGRWSNTNHFKTIYKEDAVKRTGDIVKVCTSIYKEVKYFRSLQHKVSFFRWLREEHPERVADYKNNCITGKASLNKTVRDLKKSTVGEVIKGFRMFIKKYYRPLERVAVRTPSGHVSFIPISK